MEIIKRGNWGVPRYRAGLSPSLAPPSTHAASLAHAVRGKAFDYRATHPTGETETLLTVPDTIPTGS
ncbi:MAG: hypothetical protein NTW28_03465 [Candidatus Solibacter sp.]|nr:hypothetical protein [Candidatus Solibacter sp.]